MIPFCLTYGSRFRKPAVATLRGHAWSSPRKAILHFRMRRSRHSKRSSKLSEIFSIAGQAVHIQAGGIHRSSITRISMHRMRFMFWRKCARARAGEEAHSTNHVPLSVYVNNLYARSIISRTNCAVVQRLPESTYRELRNIRGHLGSRSGRGGRGGIGESSTRRETFDEQLVRASRSCKFFVVRFDMNLRVSRRLSTCII